MRPERFVKPTLESITAAFATAEIPDDFRFSMTNAPGKDAYPIAVRLGCSSTSSRKTRPRARRWSSS